MNLLLDEIETETKEEINNLNSELKRFKDLQEIHKNHIEDFKKDENNLYTLLKESNQTLMENRSSYQDLTRRLKLYELDKCPTCESSLDTEFHKCAKDNFTEEKEKYSEKIKEVEEILSNLKVTENETKTRKNELISKGAKIESRISSVVKDLQKIENKDSDKQIQALKRIIESMENDREILSTESFKTEEKNKVNKQQYNAELVNLVFDKEMDYAIVQRVMHNSALAGFSQFKFIVKGNY
jgi:hypothetical protein